MPILNCTRCGTEFIGSASQRIRAKTRNVFCSRRCGVNYNRRNSTGSIHKDGYRLITVDGRQILEHRHVMQCSIGRKLATSECCHHINGNKLDNRIENLVIMDAASHTREHNLLCLDVERAKSLRDRGMSYKKIGKILGCSSQGVIGILVRHGLYVPFPPKTQYNFDLIKQLIDSGLSRKDIAIRVGVSANALYGAIHRRTTKTKGL